MIGGIKVCAVTRGIYISYILQKPLEVCGMVRTVISTRGYVATSEIVREYLRDCQVLSHIRQLLV